MKGKVFDSKTGETLPYANIYVSDAAGNLKPGGAGTISDLDGNYNFTGLQRGDLVAFSYTGYSKRIIPYTGQSNLDIGLLTGVELPEFVIEAKKPVNWALVVGIGIIFVLLSN